MAPPERSNALVATGGSGGGSGVRGRGGTESRQGKGPSNSCEVDKESQKCACKDELGANGTMTSRYN